MLHDRVHALERELRIQRVLVLVLLVALGALGLVAAQDPPARPEVTPVLRVRCLLVVDNDDRPVLLVGSDERGQGRLEIRDAQGRIRHWLGLTESGRGLLEVRDAEERPLLALAEAEGGGPEIVARQRKSGGFRLGLDAQEQGAFEVFNRDGHRVLFGGATTDGDGVMRVDSRDQTRAFYVGDDARGNGIVPQHAKPGARLTR